MIKRSAGILCYKFEDNNVKVLLCHFGGPYWENIDKGAWSIPKGELNKNERIVDAAKREFREETNLVIRNELKYLSSKKISHKKLAIIFCVNEDFDLSNCYSYTFKLEWPKDSGCINDFPEMDKYEWMDINKAKEMIIDKQLCFILKLEDFLK